MVNKALLVIICIFCLLPLAGCGESDRVAEENGISIEIANETEELVVYYAAFFGEDLDEWGEDLLGDEVIAPGEVYTFILPEGVYDTSLFTEDFFVIDSFFDLSEDTKLSIGGGGNVPVLIQNTTDKNIIFFYALPSGLVDLEAEEEALEDETLDDQWAETWDELWESEEYLQYQLLHDREVIISESGRRFFFISPGTYDFVVINEEINLYLETGAVIELDDRKVITVE